MTQNEKTWLHSIVDAIFCPNCGAPAAYQAQTPTEVFDVWACDTPDCPFNAWTGDRTWTLGLSS